MTATRKVVVRKRNGTISSVAVVSSSKKKYTPPKLPDKPPVTKGARSYGRSKSGAYIIPRFILANTYKTKTYKRWWVLDMSEGNIARKTNREGYTDKKEAKRIAEEYRDLYGAWTTIPF